jgi:hypothetical protein
MIHHPRFGIDSIIDVMNAWIDQWSCRENFKLLSYEDCRADTAKAFREVLAFLGFEKIDETVFAHSLQLSSFNNMKLLGSARAV